MLKCTSIASWMQGSCMCAGWCILYEHSYSPIVTDIAKCLTVLSTIGKIEHFEAAKIGIRSSNVWPVKPPECCRCSQRFQWLLGLLSAQEDPAHRHLETYLNALHVIELIHKKCKAKIHLWFSCMGSCSGVTAAPWWSTMYGYQCAGSVSSHRALIILIRWEHHRLIKEIGE